MFGAIEKNSHAGLPVPSAGLTVPGLHVPELAVLGLPVPGAIEKKSPAGLTVPSAGLTVTGLPVPGLPVPSIRLPAPPAGLMVPSTGIAILPAGLPVLLLTRVLVNTTFIPGGKVRVGRVGAIEGGDVTGQQPMFAQHFILSGQLVSDAMMQGLWQSLFKLPQSFPHQYEC
jgi:hypothetical protein